MERSFFQSAKGNSTNGLTIWIPALLTRTSILPYLAMTSAMPFSTSASLVTSIATAKASPPFALNSSAAEFAASMLRSAITGVPPSAAKRSAISLPIPLAAPVMIATLPVKRDILHLFGVGMINPVSDSRRRLHRGRASGRRCSGWPRRPRAPAGVPRHTWHAHRARVPQGPTRHP